MIDLNADLGEGIGDDAAMLALVTSASIACGGHAGDETTMRTAIRGAMRNGVRIGAHPGFADREHFGRRRLDLPRSVVVQQVLDQISAFATIAEQEGAHVSYVKLHGALANMAAEDEDLAEVIFEAVSEAWPGLSVLALAGSAQQRAASRLNLSTIAEAYADRAYTAEGQLAPRNEPGSVISDPARVVARCLRLAESGTLEAHDGTSLKTDARSICVHGDTQGALALARAIRTALADAGHMPPLQG